LCKAVRRVASLEEDIKWGHLVYAAEGPVLFIRAEPNRVLFGFWRSDGIKSLSVEFPVRTFLRRHVFRLQRFKRFEYLAHEMAPSLM